MAKTVQDLRALGFKDAPTQIPKRLITSVYGLEKSGKTHFALTAPEPIILFDIDIGCEGVVEKFKRAGKEILVYALRVPKGASQNVYDGMWLDLRARLTQAFSLRKGTVIVDTASEAYELNRMMEFGKLSEVPPQFYSKVNQVWRGILAEAEESGMNAIFIYKMKPKYIGKQRTDDWEPSGPSEVGSLAQCNLRTFRQDFPDGRSPLFITKVVDCRHNPILNGFQMAGEAVNFSVLVEMVHASIAAH